MTILNRNHFIATLYTFLDWANDMDRLITESRHPAHSPVKLGMCTKACPICKIYGFYGAAKVKERRYRFCKLCGLFQNVGEEINWGKIIACECGFVVWKLGTSRVGNCPDCGKDMEKVNWSSPQMGRARELGKAQDAEAIKDEIYRYHGY